jgi:hypothetical protein
MAGFIEPRASVMDLGCGKMWLKEMLPAKCVYYPVDYTKRNAETIVCDFNKKEFPAITADIAFVSGCLEYIKDYEWFITSACSQSNRVILSYCSMNEFTEIKKRKALGWLNNLYQEEIISFFRQNNFTLTHSAITTTRNSIFIFDQS